MGKIENLELELTYMLTILQHCYSNLDGFNAKMSRNAWEVYDLVQSVFFWSGDKMLVKYDMDHIIPRFLKNNMRFISSYYCSNQSTSTITEDQLAELLGALLLNLRYPPKCTHEL